MTYENPLALRICPKTLDDIVGQSHILGKDKLLYRTIAADMLSSVIFYGPPGTGKTTLARVIANITNADFHTVNATTGGKADLKQVVETAEKNSAADKKTILFIDEIHRFNKAQQDYLLPHVENGLLILIGATTENPYFEINKALLSRAAVYELKPLTETDIKTLIIRAVYDKENGMGAYNPVIYKDSLAFLADISGGDARRALNAIELAVKTTEPDAENKVHLTLPVIKESVQSKSLRYDKNGDSHYDITSAFIKSMRGSDPDAAVYWLARLISSGETVTYITRRIMISASEDVGLADPFALVLATNASLAAERIGFPEAGIILSHAVLYIARAPKANSACKAIHTALELVKNTGALSVPAHLQDAHYSGAKSLNHGTGYLYPHDYPNHYVTQQYLPDVLAGQNIPKIFDPA